MKKIIYSIVAAGVIIGILFWVLSSNGNKQNGDIKLETVTRGNIIVKALAIGQIVPRQEITVKSKISGILRKRYREVGDVVKKGDPLLEIDPDPTPLEFTEAKRNVELMEISLTKAETEFRRSRELMAKNMISKQDFELVQNNFEEQKLNTLLAREKFQLISTGKIMLADRQIENIIKAPISGIVLEALINVGDPVVPLTTYQAGTPLMSMADMDDLIFKGTVDEIDIGKINIGATAQLKIGAMPDAEIFGTVTRIAPKARKEGNTTLFDIEISIDDSENRLIRAGLSANGEIIIERADSALVVLQRLINYRGDSVFVEVQTGETSESIVKKMIKTGLSDGMITEIDSGLILGEKIVERPPREIQ